MNGAPSSLVSSVVLAIGIAVGGLLIGRGFAGARAADRFVTVKGVSERDVKADVALWPLRVVTSGNDLAQAQAKLGTNMTHIRTFLVRHGVDTARSALQGLEVNDAYANQYRQSGQVGDRYVVRQTLIVRSGHPEVVLAASQQVGELVGQGVVLSSGDVGGGGPTFLFTQLNALKPAMIAEATARAREAATQFARDSKSEIGGIRQASQGVFLILPRDQAPGLSEESQIDKTVRVVSTIDFYLRD
ncbi:MAG TPA: SIMPL domain-containing protein [Gemmatimonadaceae bacterium]|nr:SIMPL domain-containing protein [Gemmatimonadaceae bacterium]